MSSPILDGSNSAIQTGGTSLSISLTTTLANDIIVVCTSVENNTVSSPTVSSITASGLTFIKRTSQVFVGPSNRSVNCEMWWALATSIFSGTITINYSSTIDDASAVVFGVNGCYTFSPWDSNVNVPATETSAGPSTPSVTISTSNSDNMLISFYGENSNTVLNSGTDYPTGFTYINSANEGSGTNYSQTCCGYKSVSAPQSSVAVSLSSSTNTDYVFMVDALTADIPTILQVDGTAREILLSDTAQLQVDGIVREVLLQGAGAGVSLIVGGTIREVLMPSSIPGTIELIGVSATTHIGSFSKSPYVYINGVTASSEIGSLTVAKSLLNLDLIGLVSNTYIGHISFQIYSDSISLIGEKVTAEIGTFIVESNTVKVTQDFIEIPGITSEPNYRTTQNLVESLSYNLTPYSKITQNFSEILSDNTKPNYNITQDFLEVLCFVKDTYSFNGVAATTKVGKITIFSYTPPVPPIPPPPPILPKVIRILGRAYQRTTTPYRIGQLNASSGLKPI